MTDVEEFYKKLAGITSIYRGLLKNELEERWKLVCNDLNSTAEYEVIFGIVSRQCSFVNEMSYSPLTWNELFLPVIMRCMVENYLNIAYILLNPSERAKKFIKKGLSTETLILERIKAKESKTETDKQFIQTTESWINQQSFTFLNELNVGGWKDVKEFSDVRNTSIKANEKEYYDLFYDVCSSATHSTWNYIAKKNLKICENPLHKNHRIPIIIEPEIETGLFLILAKILQDTFDKIDNHYKLDIKINSSFRYLNDEFTKIHQ